MRAMVVLMIAVAVLATVFGLFPTVRAKAESVLFGPASAKKAAPAEPQEEGAVAAAAQKAEQGLKETLVAAKEAVTDAGPAEGGPPEPAASAPASAVPAQPAQQPPKPQPAHPGVPAAQIALPPALSGAWFGMSSSQVQAAYSSAWQRQQGSEVMFAHYPVADKSQIFRFHFANDSLFLVEIQLKRPEGQTLMELFDYYREGLAQTYQNAPKADATSWSDGTVFVHIQMDKPKEMVVISYTCPAAKG